MQTMTAPGEQPTTPSRRTMWTIGGILGFASLAAVAALTMRNLPPPAAQQPAQPVAALEAPAGTKPVPQAVAPAAPEATTQAPARTAAPAKPHKAAPAPTVVAQAPTCANCGVIESVQAVQRKGAGTGLGAVTGGVLGAVVGNQMGKGNGRSAMTVLGAVGGGFAGNEVEKRARSETVFQVRVRMDDGSVRTIEQRHAPRTGERVEVQGQNLKVLAA